MNNIKCDTCERRVKSFVIYSHTDFNNYKLCSKCSSLRDNNWILISSYMRWIDPKVIDCLIEEQPSIRKRIHKLSFKELNFNFLQLKTKNL